jgi:hypothetical protein
VIEVLSRGGSGRALLQLADAQSTVISLGRADPLMRARAEAAGATVHEGVPHPDALAGADVVLVHFWNTPELYGLLRGGLPPVRLALWVHIAGDTPPHAVTAELVELADAVVVTAPHTASLPVFAGRRPAVIPAAPDAARLVEPRPHDGFVVGYVGSVDRAKIHPRFAELCAAVGVPGVRFVVCGAGDAEPELSRAGLDVRGYVEEIGPVLAEMDVFGYPLAPDTYATSDLALQEAMAAGVPPVVLGHGLVEHGVDGLVARDEADYPRAIERLYADPEERLRLGRNARERARRRGPAEVAREWGAVLERLLEEPKRARAARPLEGAAAFVASLGDTAPAFAESLGASSEDAAVAAEQAIAAAAPVLVSAAAGGVLHYRRSYPADPHLRLWSGLVLEAQSRQVLAIPELAAARELGLDTPRVRRYLSRAAAALGAPEAAQAR